MKSLVLFATGLVLGSQLGFACEDEFLRTNTNPKATWRRYVELAKPSERHTSRHISEVRGATTLRPRKEDCFVYDALKSQTEIPCLAPLFQAYDALPKRTWKVDTLRDGKKLQVAVHEIGSGQNNSLLICLPGVMYDSFEYRFVVGALAADYDFWLIDPPGCGASDAPHPSELGPRGYGAEALAERELQAMAGCFAHLPRTTRVQLVAHSLGGLVALRAFSDPDLRRRYAEVLDRIDGLILISPCDVFLTSVNPGIIECSELSGLVVGVGKGLGMVREKVARYMAGSFYASHCLAREDVDHAAEVVANTSTRKAFQAMLHQALPFDLKTYQPQFELMKRLESSYTNINLPVRIVWGECDQVFPVAVGYMLEKRLPNARLTVIPDCKHAPDLERPAECARLIRLAQREIASERRSAPHVGSIDGHSRQGVSEL